MQPLWPHQQFAVTAIGEAIDAGHRRIVLTSPTGGGKTRIITDLTDLVVGLGQRVSIYTNRRLLVGQLAKAFDAAQLDYGVRASGWSDKGSEHAVQISSVQTEGKRVLRDKKWLLHPADLVIVDEAHVMTGDEMQTLMERHRADGATILGVTATPLDLGGLYDHLIQAGTMSELRACGALLPARHFCGPEPDLRKLKVGQDPSQREAAKLMQQRSLVGHVVEWYHRTNPEQLPTILFGPDVAGSIYFAEQFAKAGVSAAHIDGQEVWLNGKYYKASDSARADVLAGSRDGSIRVLCNRFVLREGVDCPWLAHCILATIFGSVSTYLQAVGRLLRAYPDLSHVTIQDHGGHWWRAGLGSVNQDRFWALGDTSYKLCAIDEDRRREGEVKQPLRCPKCGMALNYPLCPTRSGGCGWEPGEKFIKSRPVMQTDGTLREMSGDVYKPRREYKGADAVQKWVRMYHRAKSAKWDATFFQAFALFAQENNWGWPARTLPLMPLRTEDLVRKVSEVPYERLRPYERYERKEEVPQLRQGDLLGADQERQPDAH